MKIAMRRSLFLPIVASLFSISSCDSRSPNIVDEPSHSSRFSNWEHYGLDHSEQRFSPLSQIHSDNAHQVGLAWSLDLPGARTLQATPVAVAGVLYFTTDHGLEVYAVDGATGAIIWKYQTQYDDPAAKRMSFGSSRGVAHEKGRIFAPVADGRLSALDAKTGELLWSVRTFPQKSPRYISGAPRVFDGKVIIGHGGAEDGARGYVSTYDAVTGELLWRFFIVPGNPADGFESDAMETAAETWSGEWWRYGGGGTAWNAMTYDPEFDQVYIGTGNSGPYHPETRSPGGNGDNLFLASIVALDANTGEYRWHYQVNPREAWDYKATMDIVLAELEIEGELRKVLMQAPSNGFFYVIERETGGLLSAEKWGGKVTWAKGVDLETGRPVERSNIRYEEGEAVSMWPSAIGAHNYQPMSYNPQTGLVYLPHMELGMVMSAISPEEYVPNPFPKHLEYVFQTTGNAYDAFLFDSEHGGKGSLVAWDPVARTERWRVVTDSFLNSGTMTTAGNLVFYGTATGRLAAYDATSGAEVWSFDTGLGMISAPMSYAIGDTQYVSILVGYGGMAATGIPFLQHGWKHGVHPRRLLTFKLNGDQELPETPPPDFSVKPVQVAEFSPDPEKVSHGALVYRAVCSRCHSGSMAGNHVAPDLRESIIASNVETLGIVLREGTLVSRGMPLFDDLTDEDIEGLYHLVRQKASEAIVQE